MSRIAFIGAGKIAGGFDRGSPADTVLTHAKALRRRTGRVEIAAYDPHPATLAEFCETWEAKPFASLAALFKSGPFDVACICAPNERHFSLLQECLKHKVRAILCEKPLAMSLREAEEMRKACERQGVPLLVNYLRRWDESLSALGTEIRLGKYGKAQAGRVFYTKGIFHNASHGINLLQSWLGRVEAASMRRARPAMVGDFIGNFSLRFKGGIPVDFLALDAESYNTFEIELFFEKARLRLPGGGSTIELSERVPSPHFPRAFGLGPVQAKPGTVQRAMENVWENLFQVVQGKAPLAMEAKEAVQTIRVCEFLGKLARKRKGKR